MEINFEEILEKFKKTSGLGKKASEKLLFEIICKSDKLEDMFSVLNNIKNNFSECENCHYFKINNYCESCDSSVRDASKICVVSWPQDAKAIIDSGVFNGVFFIIKGEININKNQTPEALKIDQLFDKINNDDEVILALNSTFEGEVTANYIAKKIAAKNIKVTRLARGIPIGSVLDYVDAETLKDAIFNRKKI